MLVAIAIIIAGVHAVPMPNDIVPEVPFCSHGLASRRQEPAWHTQHYLIESLFFVQTNFVEGAATSVHAAAKQIVTEMTQAGTSRGHAFRSLLNHSSRVITAHISRQIGILTRVLTRP